MAKIIGVEVSYSEIRYVYIRKRFRGFSILKKGRISTGGFSNLKDPEKLTFTIRQLIQQERLSPAKICLALSNDDFVIHQTTPPKMTEAELDKVVQGEIEDISKFSNLDFDYIYTASKRDEQSLRILFCALARPTLHSYIQAIQKTGLRLESLVVAPLNLLDLLYAQMPKDKTQALLVLDERASFIMIFSKDDCRLFFKMATGSEDLFVRGSLDKSAFLSWTGEMKRIIQSYQREFTAQPIEKIWFSWDNEKSKELDKSVEEELEILIVSLRPQAFGGAKKEELNPIFFPSLASPLAYLRGVKHKFNFRYFLSQNISPKALRKSILLFLIYMAAVGFIAGLKIYDFILSNKNVEKERKEILQRTAVLERQTAALEEEKDSYLAVKDRLLRQAAFVRMLNRISWSKIFATISAVLPQEVSLSWFDVSESGQIKLEGSTFSIDSIADVIRKLNDVAFLEDAQFSFMKEKEIDKKKMVDFGIITRLTSQ